MSLEQIALISSIISSVAVIASLIFVGIQLKQNSLATRMMTAQINTQIMIENFGRVIDNPDIAAIFAGERKGEEVTPGDILRIGNVFGATFRHFEMLHMHQRHGIHELEMWQASEARVEERIVNPIIRGWWESSRNSYGPSFTSYIDAKIETYLNATPDAVPATPFSVSAPTSTPAKTA